jgi:hypothetical protein
MGHENGQDRLHAVVIETLCRFVTDDVGHAGGIPVRLGGDVRYLCRATNALLLPNDAWLKEF